MWVEIRNTNYSDEEHKTLIEAFKTRDKKEKPEIIAKVDFSGNIEYVNEAAKTNDLARSTIKSTQKENFSLFVYQLYKHDWCANKKCNPLDLEKEDYEGEKWVCYQGFCNIILQDFDYIRYLLPDKIFEIYKEIFYIE